MTEPLKDLIESDQAVEPDANVAEELKMLPEDEEGSDKEEMVTVHALDKMPLSEYINSSKKWQRRQKENTPSIGVSKQLNKQTAEIERMNSVLKSIQKHVKHIERQQPELIKQLQSQIKQTLKQSSQVQKYVMKKKNTM